MIDVVIIKEGTHGLNVGSMHRVWYGDFEKGTVVIQREIDLQLGVDAIILRKGFIAGNDDMVDAVLSLGKAVHDIGGNPQSYVNDLKNMTIYELLSGLANNGLRFTSVESHFNRKDRVGKEDNNIFGGILLPGVNKCNLR